MLGAALHRVLRARLSATRQSVNVFLALRHELTQAKAEQLLHIPHPPVNGAVLEVGSGQSPHPLATIVVDKYLSDDFERPGGQPASFERPLVIGDGEALPFADRTFDYVIASHVLEHASDPAKFGAEMARVGASGFVQVPSRASELLFGWPFHGWLIDLDGNALVFEPKGDAESVVGDFFHRSFAESELFRNWFALNRSTWHHSVHWSQDLLVTVRGEPNRRHAAVFDLEATSALLETLGASNAVTGPSERQLAWLRCPVCHGTLTRHHNSLECEGCSRTYPMVASVPILLVEASR